MDVLRIRISELLTQWGRTRKKNAGARTNIHNSYVDKDADTHTHTYMYTHIHTHTHTPRGGPTGCASKWFGRLLNTHGILLETEKLLRTSGKKPFFNERKNKLLRINENF